jgi:hypothetical protein
MKAVPILEVNQEYFGLLEANFGAMFAQMKQHGATPQIVAESVVSQDRLLQAFLSDLGALEDGIKEFWNHYGPVIEAHIQDLHALKVVFGGDVFPSYTTNIACSVGLYADTIILPDPLHQLMTYTSIMTPRELCRLTVKHALNALSYKELALAEVDVPIVLVTPDYVADADYRSALQIAAEADTLEHYSRLFGRQFLSRDQFAEFLEPLSTYDAVVSRIVDPARMLFDAEWSEPLRDQFERYGKEFVEQFGCRSDPRLVLEHMLLGRMMLTNDAVFRASQFGGTPLIDAPTSWRYLQWKYEYQEGKEIGQDASKDVLITKTLALEGAPHKMLSGLSPEALIELRKNGAAVELREIIRKGIAEIDASSDDALSNVGEQVIRNIDDALSEHAKQLDSLASSRLKFYGVDVGRWIVPGALSIAASVVHSVPIAFLAAASTMSGSLRPEELRQRYASLKAEAARLRRSPAGMMFRKLKKNFGFP